MYERFRKLLEQRNISVYRLCKDTGVPQATLSDWKNGRSEPKIDKLSKIAEYLEIDINYLLGTKERDPEEVPNEFIMMARKAEKLPPQQQKKLYAMLNETIDNVISIIEQE